MVGSHLPNSGSNLSSKSQDQDTAATNSVGIPSGFPNLGTLQVITLLSKHGRTRPKKMRTELMRTLTYKNLCELIRCVLLCDVRKKFERSYK